MYYGIILSHLLINNKSVSKQSSNILQYFSIKLINEKPFLGKSADLNVEIAYWQVWTDRNWLKVNFLS